MKKWADFLISEVTYDLDHKISIIKRHSETESGITPGIEIDRLSISSDIRNGFSYVTIYKSGSTWKLGHKLNSFRIGGDYFLRIDKNIAKLDYLGDLPEVEFIDNEIDFAIEEKLNKLSTQLETKPVQEKPVQEKPVQEKPVQDFEEYEKDYLLRLVREKLEKEIQQLKLDLAPEPPSSSRGSLPKDSSEELPQELDLAPEPTPEPEEATTEQLSKIEELEKQIEAIESQPEPTPEPEEATTEQLGQLSDLQHQIDELENELFSKLNPSSDVDSTEQTSKNREFEKEIEILEDIDIENEIIQSLQEQNKKLDDIEKKLDTSTIEKNMSSNSFDAYCVKCKTKRKIKNPEETMMKNGRYAIRGFCSVCNCKVFRIGRKKVT